MRKILFIIALVAVTAITSGCAGRIKYVPYGIDEMSPSDREVVNLALTDLPVCQRWTWTNDDLGRRYTINTISDFNRDVNTYCKVFVIDTVDLIRTRYRNNVQIREMACKNSWDNHWVLQNPKGFGETWFRYTRGVNANTTCASRNDWGRTR